MTNSAYRYDLHSHTTASDGTLTPSELILRAVQNQVNVLAITDHDTVKGLDEAHQCIKQHDLAIQLINGVEISTLWKSTEIHIVGLNIDIHSHILTDLLIQQENQRIERAKAIAYKLSKVSVADAYEQAQVYAKGDIVSRAHFARFLVNKGYAKDIKRAFKKYLGKSGYAYVAPQWTTIENAIEVIHQAKGQAVLAHPSRYDFTTTKMKNLIGYFKQYGGDAIEVSQSRQSIDELHSLAKCANEFNLLASQGSDFHDNVSYLDLGKTQPLPGSVTPIWNNWSLSHRLLTKSD